MSILSYVLFYTFLRNYWNSKSATDLATSMAFRADMGLKGALKRLSVRGFFKVDGQAHARGRDKTVTFSPWPAHHCLRGTALSPIRSLHGRSSVSPARSPLHSSAGCCFMVPPLPWEPRPSVTCDCRWETHPLPGGRHWSEGAFPSRQEPSDERTGTSRNR